MSHSPLEQSIYKTLAYFNLFNFPLTQEELFRYLWEPPRVGYENFVGQLDYKKLSLTYQEGARDVPSMKYGYYFLPGREAIVEARRTSTVPSDLKLKKARRAAKLLRTIPFLKAIFVSSSVAAQTAYPDSDIDFFIITKPNRIWIVRLFANLILRLLGMRVYGAKRKDRICLCFFVDTNHLNLYPYRIEKDDIHFMYWLSNMLPVYDETNYYSEFVKANNWVSSQLPNIQLSFQAESRNPSATLRFGQNCGGVVGRFWKKAWEAMWQGSYGDLIEKQAKEIQWAKMKLSLKEKSQIKNNEVVITEGILKLHENDRRRFYRNKWLQSLSS